MLSTNPSYNSIPTAETSQRKQSKSKWRHYFYAVVAFSALIALYQFVNQSEHAAPSKTLSVQSGNKIKKEINIAYNVQEMIDFAGTDVAPKPGSAEWIEFHNFMIIAMGYDPATVKKDDSISVRFEEHPYVTDLDTSGTWADYRPDGNTKVIRLDHDDVTYLSSLKDDEAKTWDYQQTLIETAGYDPEDESLTFYWKVSSDDAADAEFEAYSRRGGRGGKGGKGSKGSKGGKGGKGGQPAIQPTYAPKYNYGSDKTKKCPPAGPKGYVPNRPDCNEGWVDPGLHCFNAHNYRDADKSTTDNFNSISCRPYDMALRQTDAVPGTVLVACGSTFWPSLSKNGGAGGVWNGAEAFIDENGLPGCRTWQQKGMAASLQAWCCWPTREDGEWNGNEVELSTDIITKQETENNGFCVHDEYSNSFQTITAGCGGQQGGTGSNAKSGTMGFLGYNEQNGDCKAVRNDAGYLSLTTFRLSVGRTNPDGVALPRWDCMYVAGPDGSANCPYYDDGTNNFIPHSNWVKVGCSAFWDSMPSQDECIQGSPFDSSIPLADEIGISITGSACHVHDRNQGVTTKAKCCRLIPYVKDDEE